MDNDHLKRSRTHNEANATKCGTTGNVADPVESFGETVALGACSIIELSIGVTS